MERETIEKLAIDSAAGELNEDAELLLKAYLAEHSEANEWAEDMARLYEVAEAAIDAKTGDVEAAVAPAIVDRKRRRPAPWWPAARWAAVLAVGLFAGFIVGRWDWTGNLDRIPVMKVAEQPTGPAKATDLKAKYAGTFWGQKVLASLEPRPRSKQPDRRQSGGFWDNYKQAIEGKRYE